MTTAESVIRPSAGEVRPESSLEAALRSKIEQAARLLPAQGPITAFVHHNTLHAFEGEPFDEAVVHGARLFGCHPYLPEERYRTELVRGRIQTEDLEAVLMEDLGDRADELLGFMGTRFHLRRAMLAYPLLTGPAAELRWIVAETDALRTFRDDAPQPIRDQLIAGTRHCVMRDLRNGADKSDGVWRLLDRLFERFPTSSIETWSNAVWEEFTLHLLWLACRDGVARCGVPLEEIPYGKRHRDLLLEASGVDADRLVHDVLIRFCAAFLDQGFADWELPDRDAGFYLSFLRLFAQKSGPPDRWMRRLRVEAQRLLDANRGAVDSIAESLGLLGVEQRDTDSFIEQTLLALRGYAGMIWQLETRGDRAARPVPEGSLLEFLAVRLILDRLAAAEVAREALQIDSRLADLADNLHARLPRRLATSDDQRAFEVFQLAQVLGWSPAHLGQMSDRQWFLLITELESFAGLERRRAYHLAYERRYRRQTLDAIACHHRRRAAAAGNGGGRPLFQIVCCIDDREESFRRHLEEIAPGCRTHAAAGFFSVAMYYRGSADAHYTPLCPVIIKPQYYVTEEPVYTAEREDRRNRKRRRVIGTASLAAHVGSRTFAGGWLAAVAGSLTSIPLIMRILFPRGTAMAGRRLGTFVGTPLRTKLQLERTAPDPGTGRGKIGFNTDEMADIVERVLRDTGMTSNLARIVIICGHGSSSVNNPHEAAYNCGACSGGEGGPNARVFAQMANNPRVRDSVADRGLRIADDVVFVASYHNTCDDSVTYYDLDHLPDSHRLDFEAARAAIDEARTRSAHERCRRFETASFSLSPEEALRHVESRSEDLSQVRPECGHATNALCFVGRRNWSRGLFLDRRAFLQCYDPEQDDDDCSILTRILQAVIPVCAGINLEYYFSYVDPTGYGCGTKLPHNITSLLGVMNGAVSDLLPGLPWQMVEIHEPLRLLFVIETTPASMEKIVDRNPAIARLVRGQWVQVATLTPGSAQLHVYRDGQFEPYVPSTDEIPEKATSLDWYRGWRDHLGFASIGSAGNGPATEASGTSSAGARKV